MQESKQKKTLPRCYTHDKSLCHIIASYETAGVSRLLEKVSRQNSVPFAPQSNKCSVQINRSFKEIGTTCVHNEE